MPGNPRNPKMARTKRKSRMLELPEELLLQIFRHTILPIGQFQVDSILLTTDAKQIRLICQVCRHFYRVAQPLVYQTFQFTNKLIPYTPLKPSRQFHHLRCHPDAARYIRHVTFKRPHSTYSDILKALRDPDTQLLIRQTYSAEFCTFLDGMVDAASLVAANLEEDSPDQEPDSSHCYSLLVIYALTLAYNVEVVALDLTMKHDHDSMIIQFFDFCRQHRELTHTLSSSDGSYTDSGRQPKLGAPLSRLHTLEIWNSPSCGYLNHDRISSLITFPGLVDCRASGIRWWKHASDNPSTAGTSDLAHGDTSKLRHLTMRFASFSTDPPGRGQCGHVVRDSILKPLGRNLETLVIMIDTVLPRMMDLDDYDITRPWMDVTSLGNALRSHATRLRYFELDLYEGGSKSLERSDTGVLGNLRDTLTDLACLRAPMSRLLNFRILPSAASPHQHRVDDDPDASAVSDGIQDDLTDILPPSLRYFWTCLAPDMHSGAALQKMLLVAEDKMPLLEWVLVTTRVPIGSVPELRGTYWDEWAIGDSHLLYRRRASPGCRNTLGEKEHPVEWTWSLYNEVLRPAGCHEGHLYDSR